ncbi:serpin family protein [Streptomyces sp. NPDC058486]|uniref:serpin family protein n=1 Tax=unclassified Streptomyces TaxID=2593676 RepID=UPI00364BEB74
MTGTSGVGEAGVVPGLVRGLVGRVVPGGGDFVWSPGGVWLALAAVGCGARGRTAEELRGVLGVAGEEAAAVVTGVGRALAGADGVAGAVGVWSRVPVYEGFRDGLPGVGFGVLGARARGELDAWVRAASGGRVTGLPLPLDGSEDLVLLGALALKAAWRTAFPAGATRPAPFTDAHGAVRSVPTMHRRIPAASAWRVRHGVVVELPCAGERPVRVRFVLGEPGAGPADVLPLAWEARRAPVPAEAVDLALPRFSLRTRTDFLPWLEALGAGGALRPDADFSGLSPVPLCVSGVVQEAVLEVAEEGVEAAAVTQVAMTRSAARPRPVTAERIAFDRPFGVVVLDAEGEWPLFAGWRAGTDDAPQGAS